MTIQTLTRPRRSSVHPTVGDHTGQLTLDLRPGPSIGITRPEPNTLLASLLELERLELVRRCDSGWALRQHDAHAGLRRIEAEILNDDEVEHLWGTYLAVPLLFALTDPRSYGA